MRAERALKRSRAGRPGLRRAAAIAAAMALLALFLAARFPYERLLPPLLEAARAAGGADIQVGELRLGLGRTGPRVVAGGVSLHWPGSEPLVLEAVALRPAWSLGWLLGRPLWHVEASGPPGAFRGAVASDRVSGEFTEIDVASLPWTLVGSEAPLQGRVSGSVDLTRVDGAWRGAGHLVGAAGSVDLAGLPVAIPYQTLEAQLDVSPDHLSLPRARLEGPLVTASFTGSANAAEGAPSTWPLDLEVEIERVDPALRSYLGPLGISVGPQGRASLRVTGTLAAPFLSGNSH